MPDSKSRRDTELAKYEAMSTEELQALLREDASKPEGDETNMEVLFYVMEVLAKRRQARQEGKTPEEALESFVKNYMPEAEDASSSESGSTVRRHKPVVRRWMSGLIAASVAIVLIVSTSFTASAFGFDLWEIIVTWTQETLQFGYFDKQVDVTGPGRDDDTAYRELQAMLEKHNVQVALVPTWLPEGYEVTDTQTFETPKQRQFVSTYQFEDREIRIWIEDYLEENPAQIEQNDSTVEVYEAGGVQYYIFSDDNTLQAAWINEHYLCYISGPLDISELKLMIDSIGRG